MEEALTDFLEEPRKKPWCDPGSNCQEESQTIGIGMTEYSVNLEIFISEVLLYR